MLGRTLDELPPQTRTLLGLHPRAGSKPSARGWPCDAPICALRAADRALTGWGDTQLKVHLAAWQSLEYVLVHRVKAGQGYDYELLYDGEGEDGKAFLMGLSDPENHAV